LSTFKRILRHWQISFFVLFALYFTWQMRRAESWRIIGCTAMLAVGFLLNVLVIAVNGGYMPVALEGEDLIDPEQELYKPIDEHTRFAVLSDWIDLGPSLVSPGDLLLVFAAGAGIIGRLAGLK
jgi:hypothetical protein